MARVRPVPVAVRGTLAVTCVACAVGAELRGENTPPHPARYRLYTSQVRDSPPVDMLCEPIRLGTAKPDACCFRARAPVRRMQRAVPAASTALLLMYALTVLPFSVSVLCSARKAWCSSRGPGVC